jgi:hypothetical protein
MGAGWQLLWVVCGATTLVAGLLAGRSRTALSVGKASVGVLFVVGGALLHVINLVTDVSYADFADPAHFSWVTDAWLDVVAPNEVFFIGLLALFEATVGVLTVLGGRWSQLGMSGVIAFYLVLWIFGWFETVWVILMLPPMVLLLRAERRQVPTTMDTPATQAVR